MGCLKMFNLEVYSGFVRIFYENHKINKIKQKSMCIMIVKGVRIKLSQTLQYKAFDLNSNIGV